MLEENNTVTSIKENRELITDGRGENRSRQIPPSLT